MSKSLDFDRGVRGYLPLQQGLRPYNLGMPVTKFLLVRGYLPLQQGLRHKPSELAISIHGVRGYLPLQQGLRRASNVSCVTSDGVRDYLPLQ